MTKQTALDRLTASIEGMSGLEEIGWESPQFMRWRNDTSAAVTHIFASDPERVGQFTWMLDVIQHPKMGSSMTPEEAFREGLLEVRETLTSMLSEVEHYWLGSAEASAAVPNPGQNVPSGCRRVFIVHGRDEGMKNTVARFLERLELEPVILHEQPDRGRNLLAKLLEESDKVAFAVVLLAPDDEGRLQDGGQLRPRARQNVVFELGYLIGKLGNPRVKALYAEGASLELPSDYDGMIYLPMGDNDAWKLVLCRELKQAGVEVDANRAV